MMVLHTVSVLLLCGIQGMASSSNSKDIMDNSQIIIKEGSWLLHSKDTTDRIRDNSLEVGSKDGKLNKLQLILLAVCYCSHPIYHISLDTC
jgi:hypothetical protein